MLIERELAERDLLACAAFVAERIGGADAHSEGIANVALRYAAKNELDLAAGLADTIQDPHARDTVLSRIAEFCIEFDDDEYGFQIAEAIEDDGFRQDALQKIAIRQAAKNRFDDALATVEKIDDPSATTGDLAVRFAFAGDEIKARELLEQIDFTSVRVQVLNGIAAAHQKRGERAAAQTALNEALAESVHVEFVEEKSQLLLDIAAQFLELDDRAAALAILTEVKQIADSLDSRFRAQVYARIAELHARADDFDAAERTLEKITDLEQAATARLWFANEYLRRGDEARAASNLEETLQIVKSRLGRFAGGGDAPFNVWRSVAVGFLRLGKYERALEIAVENPLESERNEALRQIAAFAAADGKDDFARQALNEIRDLSWRVGALLALARKAEDNGEHEKSAEFTREAANLTEDIEQPFLRAEALSNLISQLAANNKIAEAQQALSETLQTVAAINGKSRQVESLARLGETIENAKLELNDQMRQSLNTIVRRSLI